MKLLPEQRQIIRDIIVTAFQGALGANQVFPLENEDTRSDWSETLLVSILGFQGEKMNGSIVLGCDEDFLRKTCPSLSSQEPNPEAFIHDWIGELSNLVMGQVKNRLLPYGILIKLNPPSISEATDMIFDTYSTRLPSEKIWFSTESGDTICFLIACEISPAIDFGTVKEGRGTLAPGSGIISLKNFAVDQSSEQQREKILEPMSDVGVYHQAIDEEDDSHEFELPDDSDFEDEHLAPICSVPTSEQDDAVESTLSQEESKVHLNRQLSYEERGLGQSLPAQTQSVGAPSSSTAIQSLELTQEGLIEVKFKKGLVFRLDPSKLIASGMANFEIQGLHVQITKQQLSYRINVAGVEISIGQNVA